MSDTNVHSSIHSFDSKNNDSIDINNNNNHNRISDDDSNNNNSN